LLRNENRIIRYLRPDGTEITLEEVPSVRAFKEQVAIKNVEIGAVKENDDIIWMEVSAVPLPSLDWRVVIITSDITERKRVEEALQKAKDDLKDKVKERTEELRIINKELRAEIGEHEKTEVELEMSKEIAEEAARAKASFMANMSHEIRTPMNAVIGMTSLLLEEDLTSDQRDFVETIRSGGDALLVIINDILDFSRLEKEKTELETQAFYLRSTIEEALDLVAAKAAEKKLNLAYTIEKKSPEIIIGDPIRLRQILANLLDNAVKFTDNGEILLSVSSKPSDKRFEFHFTIRDSGIGIPPDKINHLFESFQQVDDSISRKYGGTGLGLAISKKLVELMGGSIWLESEIGQGSTFHFIILVDVVPSKHGAEMEQTKLKGKRILIVEDNKTNRDILESQVLQWGMVPTIIGSSQEALRLIDGGDDFDIAILEMDMPEMDGLALAKEIRRRNSVIQLVMLTFLGKGTGSDLFNAVITKPIKPSQFYNVLIDILPGKFTKLPVVEAIKSNTGFKQQRILLAEDNVSNQKVIAQMLKKLGLGADIVANGVEALQALERQHYDLVLMDVRMPEMDGLDATRIIRRLWPKNKPTVIAITAYGLEGDREKCLESGMDDYISKPVKLEDLKNVLNKYAYKSEKIIP
jgi:signal transduction histidine kinase/DNA-binding response OmpR family regulator